MADYDNTNRGTLFRVDDKKSDKHPDFDGSINVGGVDYFINGWTKESKAGKKFLSLSVKMKDKQTGAAVPPTVPAAVLDDEIPF